MKYLGHIMDKDGRRPDPEWAVAIKDMPASDNIASLHSVEYAWFACPLSELLKKDKP